MDPPATTSKSTYNNLKKAMLQKEFPQKETYVQSRFSYFYDSWVQVYFLSILTY